MKKEQDFESILQMGTDQDKKKNLNYKTNNSSGDVHYSSEVEPVKSDKKTTLEDLNHKHLQFKNYLKYTLP